MSGTTAAMLAVGLVGGRDSFGQTRPRLVVKFASFTVQLGNDRFELSSSLQEFQASADQRGHRLGAAFLHLAGGPVMEFLANRCAATG